MPPRHAPHADGERDRRDGRQRLGHRGHGERDAGLDHQSERRALHGAERGDGRGHAERQPDESAAERVQSALERRALLLDRADERADAADLGLRAGGDDDGPAGARRDRRALVHQVAAIGERRWLRQIERPRASKSAATRP